MRPCGDAARRHVRLLRQHHRARAVGVVALHLGDVVGAVHVLEVRGVDAVLRHLLRAPCGSRTTTSRSRSTRDRRSPRSPGSPTSALPRSGGTTRARSRCARSTGYVRSRALRFVRWLYGMFVHAPSPSKRQPWNGHCELVVADGAAVREVRAEVRAERVLEVEVAGRVAPEHELPAPVLERGHLAGREVVGERDLEPAEGGGEREAARCHDRILEHVSIPCRALSAALEALHDRREGLHRVVGDDPVGEAVALAPALDFGAQLVNGSGQHERNRRTPPPPAPRNRGRAARPSRPDRA